MGAVWDTYFYCCGKEMKKKKEEERKDKFIAKDYQGEEHKYTDWYWLYTFVCEECGLKVTAKWAYVANQITEIWIEKSKRKD